MTRSVPSDAGHSTALGSGVLKAIRSGARRLVIASSPFTGIGHPGSWSAGMVSLGGVKYNEADGPVVACLDRLRWRLTTVRQDIVP